MHSGAIPLGLMLAASLAAAAAWSATATSQFSVRVVVGQEKCTSETVSRPTTAVVQVVCSSSNFVSIAPLRGGSLSGFSGSAFRSALAPAQASSGFATIATPEGTSADGAVGTVTSFHLVTNSTTDNLYELLISF